MQKLIAATAVFLFTLSMPVLAQNTWHRAVIKTVYPHDDGTFVLSFDSDHGNCTSASNPDYYYVRVGENGVTQEGSEKIYSAALAAAMAGREVQINFNSSTANCYINRLFVNF